SKGDSSELRFASRFAGPLQVLAGLYYEDVEFPNSQDTFYVGDPALNPFGTDALLIDSSREDQQRQKALFGERSYAIGSHLTVTGGVRVFDYDRERHATLSGVFGESDEVTRNDARDELFKVNVSYKPSDDRLLYAQWAQGFRLAGPKTVLTSNCD